jgi:hypothetical protein
MDELCCVYTALFLALFVVYVVCGCVCSVSILSLQDVRLSAFVVN